MQVTHSNLGTVNKNEVKLRKDNAFLIMTFSYETCVGFRLSTPNDWMEGVHQNDWSTTTGKLLNELEPDKSKRLSADVFAVELEKAMKLFEQE